MGYGTATHGNGETIENEHDELYFQLDELYFQVSRCKCLTTLQDN